MEKFIFKTNYDPAKKKYMYQWIKEAADFQSAISLAYDMKIRMGLTNKLYIYGIGRISWV